MTIRSFVFSRLTTDATLNSLGITANSVFTTHDADTPQVRPMIVLRWGLTDNVLNHSSMAARALQVWVHDHPGDYERIETILRRVRTLLTSVSAENAGASDEWVSEIRWDRFSEDLSDEDAGTITRNGDFTITGSAA
jgi:hypothetical protein